MSRNCVIGREGRLPWTLPRDLKKFRELTLGKPIIMGRKTYESLGHPLPRRTNIILTHQLNYSPTGCMTAHSVAEALDVASSSNPSEIMIIGGSKVFLEFLPYCQRIYLTLINNDFEGDTYLQIDFLNLPEWKQISSESWPADNLNKFDANFYVLERKQAGAQVIKSSQSTKLYQTALV